MSSRDPLFLIVVPDGGQPIEALLALLSPAEQALAQKLTGAARRHFALGRRAARAAIAHALGTGTKPTVIEILTGPDGRPQVRLDGAGSSICASISHVSRLAAACAWRGRPGHAVGVDLERVRPTRIAESDFAFSCAERALLARVPEGPDRAGLAGWAVKEAVWKALWPQQPPHAALVEIADLDLAAGQAAVEVGEAYLDPWGAAAIRARIETIEGPDGPYLLAVAQIGPAERDEVELAITISEFDRWDGRSR